MRLPRMLSVVALCLAVASPALAESPALIPVQGTLLDAAGAPVDGAVSVDFKLYADAEGAAELWTETQTISFDSGTFVAYLGDGAPIDLQDLPRH